MKFYFNYIDTYKFANDKYKILNIYNFYSQNITMDAKNFKNVFKDMFLNKKRVKDDIIDKNLDKSQSVLKPSEKIIPNNNPKKYVKYSEIIEQKIKENKKKNDDILRKFEDLDDNKSDVIQKVAEMQKLKKNFQEDSKKTALKLNEIEQVEQEKKQNKEIIEKSENNLIDLDLKEKIEKGNDEKIKLENKNSNVNVYSSDSEINDNENEIFSENLTSIPKEFHIEVCNKEWFIDIDPKK